MHKFIIQTLILVILSFFLVPSSVQAGIGLNDICGDTPELQCNDGLDCKEKTEGPYPRPRICQINTITSVFGRINPPDAIKDIGAGSVGINKVINVALQLIYVFGGVIFLFMIVISAVQWIVSGGDKEAVAKARARLTYAIIGLTILALAFVIAKLVGDITGFKSFF